MGIEIPKEEDNKELFMNLPCDCLICSEWCLNSYLKKVLENSNNRCMCGDCHSIADIFQIYLFLDSNKLDKQKELMHHFILHRFKSTCCFCFNRFDLYSDEIIHKIIFEDKKYTQMIKDKKFVHLICDTCYVNHKVKEKQVFDCWFCEHEHKITKLIKKINMGSDNNDDCIIY